MISRNIAVRTYQELLKYGARIVVCGHHHMRRFWNQV